MTGNCVLLTLCLLCAASAASEDCEKEGHRHLSTKTPYRIIANKKDSPIQFPGCTPVKIHGVIRHGTRTPGIKTSSEMQEKLNFIKSLININDKSDSSSSSESSEEQPDSSQKSSCLASEECFKKWKLKLDNEGEKFLTHEGEDEMIDLAERFTNRFPSLLNRNYDNSTFHFRFTDTQRTMESAKHFVVGLFGRKEGRNVWYPQPLDPDPILRFYKLCEKWRKKVKKNPAAVENRNKYIESEEMAEMSEKVSNRLGVNYTLAYDDIHMMYLTCSYETAWNKHKKSPWCTVFDKDDFKILEYGEELRYYWRDGYGYEINYDQACPLTQDIFSKFSNDEESATFYFTHSGTLLKLLSHLGLYKDEFSLKYDTEANLRDRRRWRVSFIDAFSSNIVFVLYKCGDEYKVLTMHQERVVKVPGCPERGLCPLDLIKQILNIKDTFDTCNFNQICSL